VRGEEIISSTGVPGKHTRPLDWIAVSDHPDLTEAIFAIRDGGPNFQHHVAVGDRALGEE